MQLVPMFKLTKRERDCLEAALVIVAGVLAVRPDILKSIDKAQMNVLDGLGAVIRLTAEVEGGIDE